MEGGANGAISIVDMGSVEGTYVNGKRVNKGPVGSGDEIRVGSTVIRVEPRTSEAAANLVKVASPPTADSASEAASVESSPAVVSALADAASAPIPTESAPEPPPTSNPAPPQPPRPPARSSQAA